MSLRDLTKEKHTDAERTEFAKILLSGNISKEQYSCYLAQMMAVYGILEHQAAKVGLFEGLHGLPRCRAILDDLDELACGVNYDILPATRAYVSYLETLDQDAEAAKKIMLGMEQGDFHIHFPKRFTNWLRLARLLPYAWYFKLIHKVTGL